MAIVREAPPGVTTLSVTRAGGVLLNGSVPILARGCHSDQDFETEYLCQLE